MSKMLLERDDLLAILANSIARAAAGEGSVALIAGEAGSGKTTLANALVDSLDDSALIIQGACDPLSTPRPLSPLYDFAADADSGLDDLPLGEVDNIEIFRMVLQRLRHSVRPILMLIEDIHWADEATLDFLRYIGRRIEDSKAVLVCTYRDDEVEPDHHLRPVLGQLIPLSWTTRLLVPLLSPEAVARLAATTELDPAALYELTDGNAFYVTEVIASGDELPGSVQEAVLARVAGLEGRTIDVVQAVSIAPRSLEVDRALLLAGGNHESIDAAVSSGVLLGDGHVLRFRHELARSAVEVSVPPAKRHTLHRQMLALLLEEDPLDHARLAHHAIQAQSPELIIEHAPPASLEAAERGSRRESVAFARAALDHAQLMDPDSAAGLRIELARHLRALDRHEESADQAGLAVEHYRRSGDLERLSEALSLEEGGLWHLNRLEEARAAGRESIDVLLPLGSSHQLGMAYYRSGHMHMLARRADAARSDTEEAIRIGREVGSQQVLWLSEMMMGCIDLVSGQGERGMDRLDASLQHAIEMDNEAFISIVLGILGSGGGEARQYSRASDALDRSIEFSLAIDEDFAVAYSRAWKARIAFEQGRWDEAAELAETVLRTSERDFGVSVVTAMGALGRVRVRRGDPGAKETLERVVEIGAANELQHVWSPISGLAEYHWLMNDHEAMREVLSEPYTRALAIDSEWAQGELGFWMWKAGAIDQPQPDAAEPFRLQMEGSWAQSAARWREIDCPYEVAFALADGGSDEKLEALATFDSLGAKPMADRIRAELRALGVDSIPRGPARSTQENTAGLTNRQAEVLQLMSEGLSNTEIAERLFISKKTVEHHVSAIFSKLGVDSRVKAIAHAPDG